MTPSGVNGPDLILSPYAKLFIRFAWECKNVEKLNIWQAIKQAEGHSAKTGLPPAVCIGRNRTDPYVAIRLSDFCDLLRSSLKEEADLTAK